MHPTVFDMHVRSRRMSHEATKLLLFLGAVAIASMVASIQFDIELTFSAVVAVFLGSMAITFGVFATQVFREGKRVMPDPVLPEVDMLAVVFVAFAFAFSVLSGFFAATLFGPPPL